MRSTTTLSNRVIRQIKKAISTSARRAQTSAVWLMLGLNGKQWTASLLIGLLLSPIFSLPVRATMIVSGAESPANSEFEPVSAPQPFWETAWTGLNVKLEEWETVRRAGNEVIIPFAPVETNNPLNDKALTVNGDKDEIDAKVPKAESEFSLKSSNEGASVASLTDDADSINNSKANKAKGDNAPTVKTPALSKTAPKPRPALLNQLPDNERDSVYSYGNNLGSPVGQTEAEGASSAAATSIKHRVGAANFNFDVPLAGLTGRGINAGVGMSYNSRAWNKYCLTADTVGCTQYHFTYDVEQSWIAPGFSTGFGSLETVAVLQYTHKSGTSRFVYYTEIVPLGVTDADGTRHQMQCSEFVPTPDSDTYRCTGYKSVDGSFIRMAPQAWTLNANNGSSTSLNIDNYDNAGFVANFPNGSKVYYTGGFGGGLNRKHYPTIIQDNNGNRVGIVYKEHQTGRIDYINDTLNRRIKFYYENDASGNPDKLVTITIPGMQNEELQTVRFYYQDNVAFNPQTGFVGEVTAPPTIRTLQYVYFPATKTGFQYEYHPLYGMIKKITRRVGMTVSDETNKTMTGTVTVTGGWTASTEYDYPSGSPALADVPKFLKRTDDWQGRTSQQPTETLYDAPEPDQTGEIVSKITTIDDGFSVLTQNTISGGLIKETSVKKIFGPAGQYSTLMAKVKYFWNTDNCPNGCHQVANPLLMKTEMTNDAGLTKATEFQYDGYNNQKQLKEYDYAAPGSLGTLLRTTDIVYETGASWINNNLLGLVKEVKVTVGTAVVSKTLYEYDGNPLTARNMDTPETSGTFARAYDPAHPTTCFLACTTDPLTRPCPGYPGGGDPDNSGYTVDHCVSHVTPGYVPGNAYRGNVTKVGRMIDVAADTVTNTNSDETDYAYDIAGNLISATLSCCQLKTLEYSSETGYAFPISETKGTSPQLTNSVVYNKYTGLVTSSTDENGQITSYEYEPNTLRQNKIIYPNGGYTQNEYSDVLEAGNSTNQLIGFVKTTSLLEAGKTAIGYTYFDGRGATLRSATQIPGNQWSISAIEYDRLGRTVKSYNPFYAYSPTGTPPAGTAFTVVTERDALGRTIKIQMQDGSEVKTEFGNNTNTPIGFNKTFVTLTDQAGKQRRQVTDSLGRIVRVDESDTSVNNLGLGAVDAPVQPTAYEYDGNDNLTKTTQTDGGTTQIRRFKYDALSRLTNEKQVEATATLDNDGIKQQSGGSWTKVLKYTPKGLLSEGTDARGVKTTFGYDGLNRLKTVVYSNETGYQTPAVTYTYDQARTGFFNTGVLTRVETAAVGDTPATATEVDYDLMGQVKQQRQSIGTQVYNLTYAHNLAGQMTSETYPSGKIVSTNYDASGRLASITDGTRTYLSNLQYQGKANSISSMMLGNGTTQSFVLNDRLQMKEQTLAKGADVLQKYQYGYGQIDSSNNLDTTKNNGQLAQVEGFIGTNKQFTQKFNYDAVGRLGETREYRGDNGSLTYKQHFDYDRFGNQYHYVQNNPTSGQQPSVSLTPIEVTDIDKATNRFTPATNTVYDDAGNILTDPKFRAMSFAYDVNGRVVKAVKANMPEAISIYDAAGQKVAERVNEVWKFYIYDLDGKMVAEYGGIQSIDEGGVKYTFADSQGSIRAITSNSGFVQARQDFTAFGEEVGAGVGQRASAQGFGATNSLNQKYAQTERDAASGLDNTWFRKLENKAGRWTSPDPYNGSMSTADPQSFNRYAYVDNDPVDFIDPSGLNLVAYSCYDLVTYWHTTFDVGQSRTTICSFTDLGGGSSGGNSGGINEFGGGGGGGADFSQAFNLAKNALSDPKSPCAALFHNSGDITPDKLLSLLMKKGNITSTNSYIKRDGIKAQGITNNFGEATTIQVSTKGVSVEELAEVIVHELGHAANKYFSSTINHDIIGGQGKTEFSDIEDDIFLDKKLTEEAQKRNRERTKDCLADLKKRSKNSSAGN